MIYSKKLWLVDLAAWTRGWPLTLSFYYQNIHRGNTRKISRRFTKKQDEEKNIFEDKRVVTKIIKMDENNQYGNAMTKPLPTGSTKRATKIQQWDNLTWYFRGFPITIKLDIYSLLTLNLITKMQQKNNYFLMKFIHQYIHQVLSASERSVFQFLDAMWLNDKGVMNSYKTTVKTHATMDAKITIPLYAKHLHLLISKCGWQVSKNKRSLYLWVK